MRIIHNEKKINNLNKLIDTPQLDTAANWWTNEGLYEKSSIDLRLLHTPLGSINLLYGPRQIGKTSTLRLFLTRVQDCKTLIYQDCSAIVDRRDLANLLGEQISGETTIVLDEVQETEGWHLALRSLYDEGRLRRCRVWCTGSEARHLLESGERLPGRRGESKDVYARPWSFREIVNFFNPELASGIANIDIRHITQTWLDEYKHDLGDIWKSYLVCGGIPAVVGSYFRDQEIPDLTWNVYRDWVLGTWSRVRTPERSLQSVCLRIFENLNSRTSFDAIQKKTDIQSGNTIKSLLEAQEDHFALRFLTRYSVEQQRFLPAKQKKIYPIDPFIAQIFYVIGNKILRNFSDHVSVDVLRKLQETAFFSQFQRYQHQPESGYLYHDATKSEIDFYFEGTSFELKSRGKPTAKQAQMLRESKHALTLSEYSIPVVAYLVGEGR